MKEQEGKNFGGFRYVNLQPFIYEISKNVYFFINFKHLHVL